MGSVRIPSPWGRGSLGQLIAAGERQRLSSGAQPLVTSNAPINNANNSMSHQKKKGLKVEGGPPGKSKGSVGMTGTRERGLGVDYGENT